MTNLKSLVTASALVLVLGAASPAIAGEHKTEDRKKVEKHDHKESEHKDKKAKKEAEHEHKEGDGHEHKDEKK